jgi:hypothetical protein
MHAIPCCPRSVNSHPLLIYSVLRLKSAPPSEFTLEYLNDLKCVFALMIAMVFYATATVPYSCARDS